MKTTELDVILYLAFFVLGFSVSELFQVIGLAKQLRRIADAMDRMI